MNIGSIIVLTLIGIGCGIIIYIAYVKIPHKVKGLDKIEEISGALPGMNCGACGFAGCFAYAQELAKNPDIITQSPCSVAMQNPDAVKCLEKSLCISLDAAAMCKKAVIHCGGNSEVIYDYSGAKSCKAAAQLWGGYKKCPYACLGFGDCAKACPQGGIVIDKEKGIAVIDRTQCTGCGLCAAECPQNLIELMPADTKVAFQCNYEPLKNIPGRGKCESGCIHCRKCFNACEYEAIIWNKLKAVPEFDVEKCTLCGKCIEACPQNTLAFATPVAAKCEAAV